MLWFIRLFRETVKEGVHVLVMRDSGGGAHGSRVRSWVAGAESGDEHCQCDVMRRGETYDREQGTLAESYIESV